MSRLIDLVREYRLASDLPRRLQLADAICLIVRPPIFAYCHRRCPTQTAEEAYSDTLPAIFKSLGTFRGTSDRQCWSWMYAVARHMISNRIRCEQKERSISVDMDELLAVVEVSSQVKPLSPGDRLDLEYAMDLLRNAKPPCTDYLWHYYVLGYDWGSMAAEFGFTKEAIQKQTARCLQLARKLVDKES